MADQIKITSDMWERVPHEDLDKHKITRASLTYWQDAWRRLKQNHLSMFGLVIIIVLTTLALLGPMMSHYSFSDQDLTLGNLSPKLNLTKVYDEKYVFVHPEYNLFDVTEKGEVVKRYEPLEDNKMKKFKTYEIDGHELKIDYTYAAIAKKSGDPNAIKYKLFVDGEDVGPAIKNVRNKTFWFGTDNLGRDVFVRVLEGARISLLIALIATLVQFFIGVLYGSISGYVGGRVDNIMMRIVDIISTIPLLLYVILLMVVLGNGIFTICIALGTVYWVRMARLVRGQVLSIKELEYVLAAKTLGASPWRIMIRHLIPNAMGAIIVSLAMMVPSAIFTEAFLSFIGLGVSAPKASWGTLASDAIGGLRTYPYQLFFPSIFITLTVLSFNFVGDGLRDALDPRLRK
jgi:oligopeptide transport system permease protein